MQHADENEKYIQNIGNKL